MPDFTCTLCGGPVTPQPISFLEDDKLWSTTVMICKAPKCLIKRGATSVEHRTEHSQHP